MIWFTLKMEPWQRWLKTKTFSEGEDGGGGGGGGVPPGDAPAGGAPSPPAAGSVPGVPGGEPASPAAGGTPPPGAPGTPAGPNDAAMWREQAEHSMRELQKTTAALQQVLRTQGQPSAATPTPGSTPGDLFNIDPKDLAGLHPAVQAMFRAMKDMHEQVGGIKTQFDTTAQETAAATEARQLKETETALNTHIDGTLEVAGLPKGGMLTQMVSRTALQTLRNLHSQGYMISKNVIDSVVNDMVSAIKQDMKPSTPIPPVPPRPRLGGGGNPELPAAPTAEDRRAALAAAISTMNMED